MTIRARNSSGVLVMRIKCQKRRRSSKFFAREYLASGTHGVTTRTQAKCRVICAFFAQSCLNIQVRQHVPKQGSFNVTIPIGDERASVPRIVSKRALVAILAGQTRIRMGHTQHHAGICQCVSPFVDTRHSRILHIRVHICVHRLVTDGPAIRRLRTPNTHTHNSPSNHHRNDSQHHLFAVFHKLVEVFGHDTFAPFCAQYSECSRMVKNHAGMRCFCHRRTRRENP